MLLTIISENDGSNFREIRTAPRSPAPESVHAEFESLSLTFKSIIFGGSNLAPITRLNVFAQHVLFKLSVTTA